MVQIRDLSSKFDSLIGRYIQTLFLVNAFKLMFQRLGTEFGYLLENLAGYRQIQAVLEPWLRRLRFLPDNLSKAEVFSITPRDFGYDSWLDKTPDSGFLESYIVRSHLLNGSVAEGSNPAPFPDFMWNFAEEKQDFRGLADWLYGGPPYGYPLGDLCVRGHREWSRRMSLVLDALLEFVGVFRQVVWPHSDSLASGD